MRMVEIPAYTRLTAAEVRDFHKLAEGWHGRGFDVCLVQRTKDGPWEPAFGSQKPHWDRAWKEASAFLAEHTPMIVWYVPMFNDVSTPAEAAGRIGDLFYMEHHREDWIKAEFRDG